MQLIPNPLIVPYGLVVGVLVTAPVGPVNVLCMQRTVERGVLAGIAAGSGAVLADGLIALLAALGVGALTGAVSRYRDAIQLVGGLALIAFGLRLSFAAPPAEPENVGDEDGDTFLEFLWDVPKTFFLTLTNPGAVLGLVAIFGGVSSFVEVRSTVDALTMVGAIMGGALAWWVFLALLIARIRHRIDERQLRQINPAAGTLLAGFGGLLVGELALQSFYSA